MRPFIAKLFFDGIVSRGVGVTKWNMLTGTKTEARAGSYYDKIASFYDLTSSLTVWSISGPVFANHPLPVREEQKFWTRVAELGY